MTTVKWHEGRMVGLDFEATGTNPHEARAVTAAIVYTIPGQRPEPITWIIDPGIDIPDDAAAVHGWTRDRILETVGGPGKAICYTRGRERWMTADAALFEITAKAANAIHLEMPLVIANAPYDLTLLEAEAVRNGIDPLTSRPDGIRGVVDPMVIDKQWDPYRKSCYRKNAAGEACDKEAGTHVCGGCRGGKHPCRGCGATDKTLGSLCAHYGVVLAGAHDATADALAAVRVASRLGKLWADAGRLKLSTLHANQVKWRAEQMDGLRSWFDREGIEHDGCCPEWPLHVDCAEPVVAATLTGGELPLRKGGGPHLSECLLGVDPSLHCTCDDFSPEWTVA